jgi:hypothetical protein
VRRPDVFPGDEEDVRAAIAPELLLHLGKREIAISGQSVPILRCVKYYPLRGRSGYIFTSHMGPGLGYYRAASLCFVLLLVILYRVFAGGLKGRGSSYALRLRALPSLPERVRNSFYAFGISKRTLRKLERTRNDSSVFLRRKNAVTRFMFEVPSCEEQG